MAKFSLATRKKAPMNTEAKPMAAPMKTSYVGPPAPSLKAKRKKPPMAGIPGAKPATEMANDNDADDKPMSNKFKF